MPFHALAQRFDRHGVPLRQGVERPGPEWVEVGRFGLVKWFDIIIFY
ncbi:hypothetical protein AAC691_18495 [Nguyenibacter vanlangensis]|uniref:Uncharacterized protein n=1 Tax=Nguyenibacter vanlangensis TaxID=1216886 RepID=A0ABZ3D398_9PROT